MHPTTPNPPNPTVSMSFIAGILLLMSVFSVLSPNTEMSEEENHREHLTFTQVETVIGHSY